MPIKCLVSFENSRDSSALSRDLAALHSHEAALRRVVTIVAANASLAEVALRVSQEATDVLELPAVAVVRFDSELATTIGGSARKRALEPLVESGGRVTLAPTLAEELVRTEASSRRVMYSKTSEGIARGRYTLGLRATVAVPIMDGATTWGALVAHAGADDAAIEQEDLLAEFAGVVELGLANEQRLQTLEAMAATDSLTGLMNHGAFFARLDAEVERARRYGRAMTLAMIDLDNFKEVNDALGHHVGDEVLVSFATFLQSFSRSSDIVARVGGEEFAWLMPETGGREALRAVERARGICADESLGPIEGRTFSVGICDSVETNGNAEDLYRLSDTALYEAKRRGRNRIVLYRPSEVVGDDADNSKLARFDRDRRLQAIQSLARSLDSPRPGSWTHSERVGDLVAKLAGKLGWAPERVVALREAASVHDVGKVGVPTWLLEKREELEGVDLAALRAHAALGAAIVEDAMSEEQTGWVRHHHERWDGTGYPDGLAGSKIPDGALIIAVANRWDAVANARSHGRGEKPVEALGAFVSAAGTEFATEVVDALIELWNTDELGREDGPPLAERSWQAA